MRLAHLLPLLLAAEGLASAIPAKFKGSGVVERTNGPYKGWESTSGWDDKKGDTKDGGEDCDDKDDGAKGHGDEHDHGGHGDKDKGHGHGHDHHNHDGGHNGGHDGGHGDDHNGDHGDHDGSHDSGKDCTIPTETPGIVTCILDNPVVPNPAINLPSSINNGGTLSDLVNNGSIPTANNTAPQLGDNLPANLFNSSTQATSYGGLNVTGANASFTPPQGTNANAIVFPGRARTQRPVTRSAEHYHAARQQLDTQPDPPSPNPDPTLTCNYAYEHVLGGNSTVPKGALWAIEGYVNLVAADVHQGGIGDCGMGAAVMALAAGGWTKYLTHMFTKTNFEGDSRVITATFQKDGKTTPVLIDDQLPVLQNANPNCWPYPGYQPVNDAAYPDLSKPTPIFFMPLFEKAFAKFLDVTPEWKSAKADTRGYEGLEGVNPAYVLAAITGGVPKSVWRTKDGFDGPILAALVTCMRGLAPCAIGTTNATTLAGLGTIPADGALWLNPAGSAAKPNAYTPGQTSGLLASDAPTSKGTYTIVDFDQVIHTPQGDRSTAITMVGNHAYAFEWTTSTHVPFTTPMVDWDMRILNPWGRNPCQWPGGCGGAGNFDEPAQVSTSFRSFAQTVAGVFTVENMPAI